MNSFIKKEEDIEDFQLFNNPYIDYYTFDIVTGTIIDSDNKDRDNDSVSNAPMDLCDVKVEDDGSYPCPANHYQVQNNLIGSVLTFFIDGQ